MTMGRHAEHVSLLFFLHFIHESGGVKPLVEVKGGAQQTRLASSAGVCRAVQAEAEAAGATVRLSAPVTRISQDPDAAMASVTVASVLADGAAAHETLHARHVIIALPLCLAAQKIDFQPPLSPYRAQLAMRASMVGLRGGLRMWVGGGMDDSCRR
jgi:monoamine oxidase